MKKSRLRKYAQLIVKSGLNVQVGQQVIIVASIENADFTALVVEEAYKLGASKVVVEWGYDQVSKLNYKYRSLETMSKVEDWEIEKMKFQVANLPARLYLISDDPDGMKGVDQEKLAKARQKSYPIMKPYIDQMENKYQWCIAGASGKKWAKKIFPELSIAQAKEKLWELILATSRVNEDPIKEWEIHNKNLKNRCAYLNSLHLKELHYHSSNGTDFKVGLNENGLFLGGAEATLGTNIIYNPNIPSEECFTSPKRGIAEGKVVATKPLSYQGQLIENFSIIFKDGKAVEVHAEKNEELLKQMIAMDEGASYLGECALIPFDSPINNTNTLFYETLYDENASCHLALGAGFNNCIDNYENYTLEELKKMGVNDSMIHVDFMIGSKDMEIMGICQDGTQVAIFKEGNWAF
jgi:aminopeptidase